MEPTVTAPPDANTPRDFVINSALTKAYTRKTVVDGVETEQMYLSGIASSSVRDRHGDTITALGQASMLSKLQTGNGGSPLAMFLNHEYNVPEDVLGTCEESELVAGAEGVIDLNIVCRVTSANPRAVMAWKIVNDGVTLGYSIGGAITECSVDEENDDGESWCPPLLIDGLDLYEISLCGIPANPRSYTKAAKGLVKELHLSENAPEPTKNWAQEMRRGFVRRATRDPGVRAQLRKALPALRASTPETEIELVALACAECDWRKDAPVSEADALVLEHTTENQGHEVDRSEIAPVTKDDDVDDDAKPSADVQSKVAVAIGSLTAAMAHGMCDDSMTHAKKAHDSLVGILTPGEEQVEEPTGDPDDVQNAATTHTLTVKLDADLTDARKQLDEFAAALETKAAEAATLDADLVAKRAEIARLDEAATTRAAEVTATETNLAEIVAQTTAAQERLDALKSTSAGRQTLPPGGTTRSGYTPRAQTLDEARRNLNAALNGRKPADDPDLRPQ